MPKASEWNQIPKRLRYLESWAAKYGIRGLTAYFCRHPPLSKWATNDELVDLRSAYEAIAKRGDADAITAWCLSIQSDHPANDVKEQVRGLLLLFERLADYDLPPFNDGKVRYISPDPPPLDWSILPAHLEQWKPWLKNFEGLRTESDFYEYAKQASQSQLRELRALKELIDREGQGLIDWCTANDVKDGPAENEAFQAGWLFLLVDFAKTRIRALRKP
jgi:hypothetical protein